MEWVWDERKAAANRAKHRVLFETAALALTDPMRSNFPDDERWRTIGMTGTRTLFVVHTIAEAEGSGRIISARRATPLERKSYEASRY